MAQNNSPTGLELINQDYQSARDSLLSRVQARWTQAWNDFLANSFGRVLVDLMAYSKQTLIYSFNRLVAENFISTMQLRESASRIGSLVDYRLGNPGPATVLCEAIMPSPASSQVTLFKGTLITSSNTSGTGVTFELTQSYIIEQGQTYPQQLVLFIGLGGGLTANTLQSLVTATAGSTNLDVIDTTVDLTTLISAGQVLTQANPTGTTTYVIQDVTNAPTSTNNNRIVVSPAWTGATGSIEVNIYERRVEFVQGQTYTDNFTTGSSVTPSALFTLSQSPVIDGSTQVTVDGTLWTETQSLATAGPTDTVYQIKLSSSGSSVIVFGDNSFGQEVPTNSVIVVQYRVGGGSSGNISLGTINTTALASDFNGNPIPVTIQNLTSPGEGGTDLETLQQARLNIPAFINTNQRAVTLSDYATFASSFSSPTLGSVTYARATTLARNALVEGNIVFLYAWTNGPGGSLIPLSSALKTALQNYLQGYANGNSTVLIADGTAVPTPIALRFLVFAGFDVVATNLSVQNSIYTYVASLRPGDPIVFSTVMSALTSLPGVNSVNISTPNGDVTPSSSTQVFTPPTSSIPQPFNLVPDDTAQLVGQSPVVPLQPWSGTFTLGGNVLTMLPSPINGYAIFVGPGLASQRYGPLANRPTAASSNANTFWYDTDGGQNYLSNGTVWSMANGVGSGVNLSNGQVRISTTSSFATATLTLTLSQGYTAIRTIPIYIGYTGDTSATKMAQIRSNLRAWNSGFGIGQSLFASILVGSSGAVLLDASRCNVSDAVLATPGVISVNSVSLNSPGNSSNRLDVGSTELIILGDITLNGSVN